MKIKKIHAEIIDSFKQVFICIIVIFYPRKIRGWEFLYMQDFENKRSNVLYKSLEIKYMVELKVIKHPDALMIC